MAIKTFTAGSVLTASDTNTYLNNGGLVYITEATATNGSAALSFNNCFTSTYTNYRIITTFANATAGYPAMYFRMRVGGVDNSTNNYYYMGNGRTAANVDASFGSAGATTQGYVGSLTGTMVFDIFSPQVSGIQTTTIGQSTFYDGTNFTGRTTHNWHNVTSSFDGITFYPATSTLTNTFTVRIYGYRQA